ncbi:MAG TPA: VOC family protein [Usitatibacteraceae bacterium]|nr:VOC family protein [Usitatibacteraceae bacterium]
MNQVTVPVRDIDESVVFYQTLGLTLIVLSPHYARFACGAQGSTFSIHRAEPGQAIGSSTVVYFESDRLDEWCEELAGKGIAFESRPADQPWLWREARLRDPSGNPICLYFGGENRLHPPWRLKDTKA